LGRVHANRGFAFLDGCYGVISRVVCRCDGEWRAGGEGCEFWVGDFDVVYEDVSIVYGCGELVGCSHVVVNKEGKVVSSWCDGDVGGEGIFLLAGSAREMSILRLCSVTSKEAVIE
jgi:hypothetical protein